MGNKFLSLLWVSVLVVSVFSVGVFAQEESVAGGLDIADETGSSFAETVDCALISCSDGYTCEQGVGCVFVEEKRYGNCGDEEYWDYVSQTCRGIGFNYAGNYEAKGFFGRFTDKLKIALSSKEDKVRLSTVIAAEEIAEFERAVAEGDEEAIAKSVERIRNVFADAGTYLEEYAESVNYDGGFVPYEVDGPYQNYKKMKWSGMQNIDKLNEIKRVLLEKERSGEISREMANEAITKVVESLGGLAVIIENGEKIVVDKTVEASKGEVTKLEVDYYGKVYEKDLGIEDRFYLDSVTRKDIALDRLELDNLRNRITESDERDFGEVGHLFQQARMRLQDARNGLNDEDYGDAVNGFMTAEYIITYLENYLKDGENALRDIEEFVDKSYEELNTEIEIGAEQVKSDYETEGVRERIVGQYPELKNDVDKTYTKAVEVVELAKEIEEVEEAEIEKLKYSGDTEEDAAEEVERLKSREYFYKDGGKYIPEGYVKITDEDGDGNVDFDYGGGFIKGYTYRVYSGDADSLVYGSTGYSWQSPLTNSEYRNRHPADYEPERFETGDESFGERVEINGKVVVGYLVETEGGSMVHQYTATGYRVVREDGEVIEEVRYSDIVPQYEAVGGAVFRTNPFGIDVVHDGVATRYTMNPETGVWEDVASGHNFAPEISLYDVEYDSENKVYVYDVGPSRWMFNPDENSFENDEGVEVTTVPVPEVPIGLEGEVDENGELVLKHGEIWVYDEEEESWTSQRLDEETGEVVETEYLIAPNQEYRYDKETGEFVDSNGERHEEAVFRGEEWDVTGSYRWYSESGVVYDPSTGLIITSEEGIIGDEEGEEVPGGVYVVSDNERTEVSRSRFVVDGRFVYRPGVTTGARGDFIYVRGEIPDYNPDDENNLREVLDEEGNIVERWILQRDGRWGREGSSGNVEFFGYENYYQSNIGGRNAETGYYRADTPGGGLYYYNRETGEQRYVVHGSEEYQQNEGSVRYGYYSRQGPGYVGAYDNYYSSNEARNYNYVQDGEAYYFPPGISPGTLTAEDRERYRVNSPYGYDPAFGTRFGGEVESDYYRADDGTGDLVYYDASTGTERRVVSNSEEYARVYAESNGGFRGYYAYDGPGGSAYGYSGGYGNYRGSYSGAGSYGKTGDAFTGPEGERYTYNSENGGTWTDSQGNVVDINPYSVGFSYSGSSYGGDVGDYGYGYRDYSYGGSYGYGESGYYSGGAGVGTTVVGDDGQTYTVTSDRGWTNAQGQAVSPPVVGGVQQPSSAVGSYGGYGGGYSRGGYYDSSGAWVSSGSGSYYSGDGSYVPSGGGGYYDSSGAWVSSGSYGGYYDSSSGTYSGSYPGYYGGYYDSSTGTYVGAEGCSGGCYSDYGGYDSYSGTYYSGSYTGGGGYDSSGNYVGGDYGNYDSSGYYTGGGGTGGGSYTGGDGSGTVGGDGGGTATGGDGTGTGGGDGGGGEAPSGGVIAEEDAELDNWFVRFWKRIFGF